MADWKPPLLGNKQPRPMGQKGKDMAETNRLYFETPRTGKPAEPDNGPAEGEGNDKPRRRRR